MTDSNIRTAVDAWLANPTAAEATYGHISTWETGGVTDMEELFEDASSFNEDIGEWDISGVTTMEDMFRGASAFDQDLGWCVSGDLTNAFTKTQCESTSCGVIQGTCAPTPAPTPAPTTPAPTPAPTTPAPTPAPTTSPAPTTLAPTPAPTPGVLGSDGAAARSVALCLIFLGAALA